jgi:hypothetical protein
MRSERLQRDREILERMELADDYLQSIELLSGIDVRALAAQCDRLLADSQPMWDELFRDAVRRELHITPGEAERSDALALFRGRRFDAYFPAREMEERVLSQADEMGLDPRADGRITLDTGDRPGKRARAFCAPVRVPDEVYLVTRPHGGQQDWMTFLHELGHSLHYASMRATLPFEYRWLGDNSVTEGFAMLFDHLLRDAGWLRRYTDLGATRIPGFMRAAAFEELHMLRRYAGKLLYEVDLYSGAVGWESLPRHYVDRMTAATSFRYDEAMAFVDVDPRLYAARYLRAWQLQAVIAETLTQRYDADWWRNPRAGPWLRDELMSEGQRETGVQMAERVAGARLDFAPLLRTLERVLS